MANILVIDDDSDVRQILRVMLKRGGHDVTLAPGGVTGLEYVNQQDFDLIITDVMMPDMDGYQVTRRLRATPKHRNQVIMILTARAQPADYQAAMASGADAYLSKPVTHDVLNARVAELLKVKEARAKALNEQIGTASAASASTTAAATNEDKNTTGTLRTNLPPATPTNLPSASGRSRYIAVFTLQGGVGSTTIAVNLAGALVRLRRRVCLLDLSTAIGQIGQHLRLKPEPNWQDLPLEPDSKQVGKTLLKHPNGLFVLAAPDKPVRHTMPVPTFTQVLQPLSGFFNDVVFDLPHTLDPLTLAALNICHLVLLVAKPDPAGLFVVQQTLPLLYELGLTPDRIRLLLNHPAADLNGLDVASQLPKVPDLQLPFDSGQSTALATGQPLVFGQPNNAFASALGRFATTLPQPILTATP